MDSAELLAERSCPEQTYASCKEQWQQDSIERYCIHYPETSFQDGDTLVFIEYPSPSRAVNSSGKDCDGQPYRSKQFRVHSERLLATGSEKFAEYLRPTYQFRIQRRRKLVNKLPDGVRFVMDLTPPEEGEDLVFQMTELSLTPGIINWWTAPRFLGSAENLTEGHDDICECWKYLTQMPADELLRRRLSGTPEMPRVASEVPAGQEGGTAVKNSSSRPSSSSSSSSGPSTLQALQAPKTTEAKPRIQTTLLHDVVLSVAGRSLAPRLRSMHDVYPSNLPPHYIPQVRARLPTPEYRKIEDYCPFRHRNAIIRLLLLIENKDVSFNSAPRLWTLVGVSKIFDCEDVLAGPVEAWLMAGNNSKFIEVLPEEAIRIGFALQLETVTQAAFRILVNEMAIDLAATDYEGCSRSSSKVTVFGRKREDLDDEINGLVQHAAQALHERIEKQARLLREETMATHDLPAWRALQNVRERLLEDADRWKHAEDTAKSIEVLTKHLDDMLSESFQLTFVHPQRAASAVYSYTTYSEDWDTKFDQRRACYLEYDNFEETELIFSRLNVTQRLLCGVQQSKFRILRDTHFLDFHSEPLKEAIAQFRKNATLFIEGNAIQPLIRSLCLPSDETFDLYRGLDEVKTQLMTSTDSLINTAPHIALHPFPSISSHLLLALNDDEIKYLPLFAGGLNDGTGGVFEGPVPESLMGPDGPGPSYHTGMSAPSATGSLDSFVHDIRGMQIMGSSTAGSVAVNGSSFTGYNRSEVIAEDHSIASLSDATEGAEYAAARINIPADHQPQALALRQWVESHRVAEATDADINMDDQAEPIRPSDSVTESGDMDWEDDGSDTASEGSLIDLPPASEFDASW